MCDADMAAADREIDWSHRDLAKAEDKIKDQAGHIERLEAENNSLSISAKIPVLPEILAKTILMTSLKGILIYPMPAEATMISTSKSIKRITWLPGETIGLPPPVRSDRRRYPRAE